MENKSLVFCILFCIVNIYIITIECVMLLIERSLWHICPVCSSPLQSPGRLKIVFNVIEQPAGNGRYDDRRGLCSGWLSDLSLPILPQSDSVESTMEKLAFSDKPIMVSYAFINFYCVRFVFL